MFVDTNVLLYAFAVDKEPRKLEVASGILAQADIAFSIQVFQEFYFQATHSRRIEALTSEEAESVIEALSVFPVQENTLALFKMALLMHRRYRVSFWDASILAAAQCLNCSIVLSEDLGHQQRYGTVQVLNPFLKS